MRLSGTVPLSVGKASAETCYQQKEIETDLTLSCAEMNDEKLCNGIIFRKRKYMCRNKNYNILPDSWKRSRPRWCPLLRR